MNAKWIVGLIAVIVVAVLGFWSVNNSANKTTETDPIKIGLVGPLTGDAATIGTNAAIAAQIAVDEINAAGGIDGRQIELISEDGQCTGRAANSAAQKLISADQVDAIIGGMCSAETLAFTTLAEESQTPMISPLSSSPDITAAGDYVFRVYPSDLFQGVFAAEYLKKTLGKSRAAVLYTNDEWGGGLQETFINAFEGLGGEVVIVESFEKTARDLRTQLTKIKGTEPEALFFLGFTESSIAGIRQLSELGFEGVTVMGADAWGDPTIWEAAGSAGEGLRYSETFVPENETLLRKLEAKGASATPGTAQSYDIVYILAEVIDDVGTDSVALKERLYETKYNGLSTEEIRFDENGDLVDAAYAVKVITDGSPVTAE